MSQLNRKKMKNINVDQWRKLMELLQRNPDAAKGFTKLRSGTTAGELWDRFAVQLNILGPPFHEGKEWHKVWLDYKMKLMMKIDANRQETDGEEPPYPRTLSAIQTTVDKAAKNFTLHTHDIAFGAGPSGSESRFNLLDNDNDDSDGETSDVTSEATDGSWETFDVASGNSDADSEGSDVASENSDVTSESSDVTSESSDLSTETSGVVSEISDATSETSGTISETFDIAVTSETSGVATEALGVSSETFGGASDATSESLRPLPRTDNEKLKAELLKTAQNIEKDIHDIAKIMREGFKLKCEKLALLKAKEERQQKAYIDQQSYNKEKLDIELLYLKLNMLQFLANDD